jgi:hypothetical protein
MRTHLARFRSHPVVVENGILVKDPESLQFIESRVLHRGLRLRDDHGQNQEGQKAKADDGRITLLCHIIALVAPPSFTASDDLRLYYMPRGIAAASLAHTVDMGRAGSFTLAMIFKQTFSLRVFIFTPDHTAQVESSDIS